MSVAAPASEFPGPFGCSGMSFATALFVGAGVFLYPLGGLSWLLCVTISIATKTAIQLPMNLVRIRSARALVQQSAAQLRERPLVWQRGQLEPLRARSWAGWQAAL